MSGRSFRGVMRRAGRWTRTQVASAPGTYVWLLILVLAALQFQQLPSRARRVILHVDSTNLYQLTHHPLHVLVLSALWTQLPALALFLVLFHVIHVPVERWVGTARWLAVVALAHVGATLVSEAGVWLAIHDGIDPGRMRYTLDIGASYGLAGAAGLLTYRLGRRWRWAYLAVAGLYLGGAMVFSHTFTDLGHLVAFLIGLCCRPLTRNRPRSRAVRRSAAAEASAGEALSGEALDREALDGDVLTADPPQGGAADPGAPRAGEPGAPPAGESGAGAAPRAVRGGSGDTGGAAGACGLPHAGRAAVPNGLRGVP